MNDTAQIIRKFARSILHGDDDHRAWLLEAAECFIEGKAMPPPRGKGVPPVPAPSLKAELGQLGPMPLDPALADKLSRIKID
jgi:hypothetical protein